MPVELDPENMFDELISRLSKERAMPKMLTGLFPQQEAFIKDPAKLKLALCTRRAGKSYACGQYLVKECLDTPGVKCLYLAKTRLSARSILWDDILKVLNVKFNLGAEFLQSELRMVFPNKSSIQLLRADQSESERDK